MIGEKIMDLTERLTVRRNEVEGKDHGANSKRILKDDVIHVSITKSSGPTLTLIDLPGLTHISD